MKQFQVLSYLTLMSLPLLVWSQTPQVRERNYVNDNPPSHLYLNLHVPAGELYLQASPSCGLAQTKVISRDSSTKWILENSPSRGGNVHQEGVLHYHEIATSPAAGHQANLRHTYRVDPMASQRELSSIRSEYLPDPTQSTDLTLHLGKGSTLLDLSGLTLNKLTVESAFSDLVVSYSKPNQMAMQMMAIHVANADVVLKHMELSRAQLIRVQNDMGGTRLLLGRRQASITEHPIFELKNGVGDCKIFVERSHPVRVLVKTGVLAKVVMESGSGFEEVNKSGVVTYENASAIGKPNDKVTMIHCDLDFGELLLMSR